jgi:hypothetical protein
MPVADNGISILTVTIRKLNARWEELSEDRRPLI